jgi:hypothetical protein
MLDSPMPTSVQHAMHIPTCPASFFNSTTPHLHILMPKCGHTPLSIYMSTRWRVYKSSFLDARCTDVHKWTARRAHTYASCKLLPLHISIPSCQNVGIQASASTCLHAGKPTSLHSSTLDTPMPTRGQHTTTHITLLKFPRLQVSKPSKATHWHAYKSSFLDARCTDAHTWAACHKHHVSSIFQYSKSPNLHSCTPTSLHSSTFDASMPYVVARDIPRVLKLPWLHLLCLHTHVYTLLQSPISSTSGARCIDAHT